jgi:hypothetical protein
MKATKTQYFRPADGASLHILGNVVQIKSWQHEGIESHNAIYRTAIHVWMDKNGSVPHWFAVASESQLKHMTYRWRRV